MSDSGTQYNPSISVDCVVFGFDGKNLKILLIDQNGDSLNNSKLKLPGSLVRKNRDLDEYADLVLKELTGLDNVFLRQLYTFGSADRISLKRDREWIEKTYSVSIRRIVSTAYYSLIKIDHSNEELMERSHNARWYDVSSITTLALDHYKIMQKGLDVLRQELRFNPIIGFELLPEKFSLRNVQNIYEAITGNKYDNRNFRKKLGQAKYLTPLNEKQKGVAHKPAVLYSFDKEKYFNTRKEINLFYI